jgi:hypothetical protein
MDISTLLKFVGIVVAGALGVLGTVTETRNKETSQLTIWGRCALWLTIAGAGVAFGAQLFDSINQAARDKSLLQQNNDILSKLEAQSTTANKSLDLLHAQSTTANKSLDLLQAQFITGNASLDSIQDLLSQFNGVHINAEFELPQTDRRVAALAGELHGWANSDIPELNSARGATNCVGFNLRKHNATIICSPLNWNQTTLSAALPSLKLLSDVWGALPLMTGRVWINRINKPLTTLLNGNSRQSDLFFFNSSFGAGNQGGMIYYESNKKIYIMPSFFSVDSTNSACWFSNNTIDGIHHLAGSHIVVEFNWRKSVNSSGPDPLLSRIRPDFVNVSVGHSSIFLKGLTTTVREPEGLYRANFVLSEFSEASLPNEEDILSGRAAAPPARMLGSQ